MCIPILYNCNFTRFLTPSQRGPKKSCVIFIFIVVVDLDLDGNIKTLMNYCGIQLHGEILMKFVLHNLDKNLMQFGNMTERFYCIYMFIKL